MERRNTLRHLAVFSGLLSALACWTGCSPLSPADAQAIDALLGPSDLESRVLDTGPAADCIEIGQPATDVHEAMVEALNAYRQQNGLSPLEYSKRLQAAADDHVRDCWSRDFFDHINPEGQAPSDRAVQAGFCHPYVGENIAAGQRSVEAVMTAWENSPAHNANMLNPGFVYVGMGHFADPNGRHYWGQLFALQYP